MILDDVHIIICVAQWAACVHAHGTKDADNAMPYMHMPPGHDQQAMVSTAGHFGNSYPNADSAGQLSNSPPGSAPPELFRQSPYGPAVSGQFRQRPPAWDPEAGAHRLTVQMQTGDLHAEARCQVVFCDLPLATGSSTMSTTLVLHVWVHVADGNRNLQQKDIDLLKGSKSHDCFMF